MTTKTEVKWACPKCAAGANKHGDGGEKKCKDGNGDAQSCNGMLCECDDTEESREDNHGTSLKNPCTEARCYHCGWAGTFPAKPKGLLPWEKKAIDAGWDMPAKRKKELGL